MPRRPPLPSGRVSAQRLFGADRRQAIRVGLLTRTAPDSWLTNQVQWDLWQSGRKPKPKVQPLRRAA